MSILKSIQVAWRAFGEASQAWQIGVVFFSMLGLSGSSMLTYQWLGSWPATILIGVLSFILFFIAADRGLRWFGVTPERVTWHLGEAMPGISVEVRRTSDSWFADVVNTGEASAIYQAQIEIRESDPYPLRKASFSACWNEGKLNRDHWTVGAQEVQILPKLNKSIALCGLEMGIAIFSITPEIYAFTNSPFDRNMERLYGGSWTPSEGVIPQTIVFELIISSSPPLRDGAFRRVFQLDHRGLHDVVDKP